MVCIFRRGLFVPSPSVHTCALVMTMPAPQSVGRILAIFRALANHEGGMTLTALAQHLAAPKTSLVGLLNGLIAGGYLVREESSYRIGQEMFLLATQIVGNMRLPELISPSLDRLMAETGETALAGQLAPDEQTLVYFAKSESTHPVRYTAPVGKREELYSTAMGKLLLAYMEPERQKRYLNGRRLYSFTDKTLSDATALLNQLREIRASGVSQTIDERVVGASAVAIAVTRKDGGLLFGLGLAGPTERMITAREAHIKALKHERAVLERLIGTYRQ